MRVNGRQNKAQLTQLPCFSWQDRAGFLRVTVAEYVSELIRM